MPRGKSHPYRSFQAFSTFPSLCSPSCLSWVKDNGLLVRNGQHKWKRTNKTLEGVSNRSKYPGQQRKYCPLSVPDSGRGAKLVTFYSVSQFCHFGDEAGFTLERPHMRRVTFWILWVLITKFKKIKKELPQAVSQCIY